MKNQKNEAIYTSYGSPIFDPENDYDESRESDEETEYDDEGYPVAIDIPTLEALKTPQEILKEEKEQRKIAIYVILACIAIVLLCFGLAFLLVK